MEKANISKPKYIAMCLVFVVALAVIAISVSYAILFIPVTGDFSESSIETGDYKFNSNLDQSTGIDAKNLGLIEEDEIGALAPSASFSVRAQNNRTDVRYNVYLKDIAISNNLIDSIGSFKWQLLKDGAVIEQGDFRNIDTVGIKNSNNIDTQTMKYFESYDLKDGLAFNGLNTTEYTFRVYILNDDVVDQTAMTNGTFQAKLGVSSYIASYKCTRAKTLHVVNGTTYGNLGTLRTTPNAGDAFDCDVNGDGKFDTENERFYYVSHAWKDGNFLQTDAVLVSANSIEASSWGASASAGPASTLNSLPLSSKWRNVDLISTTRNIYQGTSTEDLTTVAKNGFIYSEKTTRLLTAQELLEACPDATTSLNSCKWLLENTKYQNANMLAGYWLETAYNGNDIWVVDGENNNLTHAVSTDETNYAVRPVIEVQYSNIDY